MTIALLHRRSAIEWEIHRSARMIVPGIIYATKDLVSDMDSKVFEQVANVAMLPGIVKASFAMPDAHWGYGFAIGGVAAFDPDRDGIISAGGVGFDISCGVRTLHTGLLYEEVKAAQAMLADALYLHVPAGVGSTGKIHLGKGEMDAMLIGGAKWAVERAYGDKFDLEHTEERGCMKGADPSRVSFQAKDRQRDEMGTLGSGNHYLEVQQVVEIFDEKRAAAFGLRRGECVVSIHCGSRGLGHQIGTDYLRKMVLVAGEYRIDLPDRELACAPIHSTVGQDYLGAMRCGINCALANRQIITHLTRRAFAEVFPQAKLSLLYDVSHNTCKEETHLVDGVMKRLFVHRKGATRAFGPGHPDLPADYRESGQPVLIGGTMGTASYILAGTTEGMSLAFGSACHGAGRRMSRNQALKQWRGRQVIDALLKRGILVRSPSTRGVAEEAPDAYKDVAAVADAADQAKLALKVARLEPVITIKG